PPTLERRIELLLAAMHVADARELVALRGRDADRRVRAPDEVVGNLAIQAVAATDVESPAKELVRRRDAAGRAIRRRKLRPLVAAGDEPRHAAAWIARALVRGDVPRAKLPGPIPSPAVRVVRRRDAADMPASR